jgi:hypothetical protein
MAVVIDEMLVDVSGADESKKRGGGDSQSDAGSEPPKPEEIEHALRQQVERMERIRAH